MIGRGAIKQPKIVKRKMESGRMGQDYLFDGENGKNDAITVMYRLAPKYVGKLKAIWENPEPVESPPSKPALTLVPQVAPPISKLLDGEASMTSQEIADLVGSQHVHLKISIERLVDRGVIQGLALRELRSDSGQLSKVYVFTGPQGKRDSIVVVAQNSPEFTAVLVDRWQELETQVAEPKFKVPTTLHGALLLAANLEEQRQALTHQVEVQDQKIAEDKPKVDYYHKVRASANTESIGSFAKKLEFGEKKLFRWLREQKILMSDNSPYQRHIDAGHFKVLDKTHDQDGKIIAYSQTVLTGKGKTYVQYRLAKAGNPDLSE